MRSGSDPWKLLVWQMRTCCKEEEFRRIPAVDLRDKVTVEHQWGNHIPTYRMVPLLMTLNVVKTRRTGLSASAELLVLKKLLLTNHFSQLRLT